MPCPFAPLLALVPAIPLIPWYISKYLSKKGVKQGASSIESTGSLRSEFVLLPILSQRLDSFQFYQNEAPKFSKVNAIKIGKAGQAEFFISNTRNEFELALKLAQILSGYPITRAKFDGSNLKLWADGIFPNNEITEQLNLIENKLFNQIQEGS